VVMAVRVVRSGEMSEAYIYAAAEACPASAKNEHTSWQGPPHFPYAADRRIAFFLFSLHRPFVNEPEVGWPIVRAWTSTALKSSFQARSFLLREGGRLPPCDLREVHDPVAAVAVGDGETHCSKVRSDEVQNGSSLRSQASDRSCGFTVA
jgi:hypothetical protein